MLPKDKLLLRFGCTPNIFPCPYGNDGNDNYNNSLKKAIKYLCYTATLTLIPLFKNNISFGHKWKLKNIER